MAGRAQPGGEPLTFGAERGTEETMKVTVEVPEKAMREMLRFSGERLRASAILRLALNELNYRKRLAMDRKFHSRRWSVDLPPIEQLRRDRRVWQ
jgi:hypothetical protein